MPNTRTAQEVECADRALANEIWHLQHALYRLYSQGEASGVEVLQVSRLLDATLLRYQAAFPSKLRDRSWSQYR